MGKISFQDVSNQLEKLKAIYETLGYSKKNLQTLNDSIRIFNQWGDISIESYSQEYNVSKEPNILMKQKKAISFANAVDLLFQRNYTELRGTKINYQKLTTSDKVVEFFEQNPKTKILKETTALDLKLLYCLLTGERNEIKRNKSDVYDAIKGNIRARKRGEAFSKIIGS